VQLTSVREVDPFDIAEQASALLRNAWTPPSLCYSSDYLRWQFSFPGNGRPAAFAACSASGLVAFAALVPRSVAIEGRRFDISVLTFVAVAEECRGRGLCTQLYEEALWRAATDRRAVLLFVAPDSASERGLRRAAARLSMPFTTLDGCRTYAAAMAPSPTDGPPCLTSIDAGEYRAFVADCGNASVIQSTPDEAQLEHYRVDPRGREIVAVVDAAGEWRMTAMLVCAEVAGRSGTERLAMLDSVQHRPALTGSELRPLVGHASALWRGRLTHDVMTAPSVATVDPVALKAAGLRATSTMYRPYVLAPSDDSPLLAARSTNVEVM
jgi:hypothetical protein